MNPTHETCRCGRPTRDAAYVCEDCLDLLARALGEVPWLAEELDTTVARQIGVDYRRLGGAKGGKKPAEMPSPANMVASEARTHLHALLVSWVRLCQSEHVRHRATSDDTPADNLIALSRWMMNRVDGLGLHEAGSDAVEEIESAVAHCRRLIDRPADRQYLGHCESCEGGRIYSTPGSDLTTCHGCDARVKADIVKGRLIRELEDRLCTAAEIAHLSTYLGLRSDREQVRKRINQWAKRGSLLGSPSVTGESTFRFGEVYTRLMKHENELVVRAG